MNRCAPLLPFENRLHIENDELILCLRQDQLFYAKIMDRKSIFLVGPNLNYSVDNNINIKQSLLKNGFIRISNLCYVNPHQIQEYNFVERKIRLHNGWEMRIVNRYVKNLADFLTTANLIHGILV